MYIYIYIYTYTYTHHVITLLQIRTGRSDAMLLRALHVWPSAAMRCQRVYIYIYIYIYDNNNNNHNNDNNNK